MPEPNWDRTSTDRHETTDPRNPPNAVLQPSARRGAVRTFVGGIAVVFLIVAAVFAYRSLTDSGGDSELDRSEPSAVGTAGDPATEESPGGFDPAPSLDSTASELEFRGAGDKPQGPMPGLTTKEPLTELSAMLENSSQAIGRRIDVQDVEVQNIDGNTFVIRDGNARASVLAAPDAPQARAGQRVDVSGTVEPDGQGGARIRASRVNVR